MSNAAVSGISRPAGGLRARQREERRKRLVKTARELLRSNGETGFSMSALAAKAGFSLATPYNLFGSKAAILYAVFETEIASFHRKRDRTDATDPVDMVFAASNLLGEVFTGDKDFFRQLTIHLTTLGDVKLHRLLIPLCNSLFEPLVKRMDAADLLDPRLPAAIITSQFTHVFQSIYQHWVAYGWRKDRLVAELDTGFGLVLLGVLREAAKPPVMARIATATEITRADMDKATPDAENDLSGDAH